MSTIEIKGLFKAYGKTIALRDVSATMAHGKVTGLLGRNGAGKTTLLNIITNHIFADYGEVWIDGQPAQENDQAQAKIFYMTEKTLYPKDMRMGEVFCITQMFYPTFNMDYAQTLAEQFQLEMKKKVGGLSTGYLTILKLILALASNAETLIFDEPVLGLDANHREMVYKEILSQYKEGERTMIISTHLIDEVARLLEEVIILHEGKILISQPVEALQQRAFTVSGEQAEVDSFVTGKNVVRVESLGRYKTATLFQECSEKDLETAARLGLELSAARLQDIFISLTHDAERRG